LHHFGKSKRSPLLTTAGNDQILPEKATGSEKQHVYQIIETAISVADGRFFLMFSPIAPCGVTVVPLEKRAIRPAQAKPIDRLRMKCCGTSAFHSGNKKGCHINWQPYLQVASPRVPVIYHSLSETINLNWEGFQDPLSYSD